MLKLTLALGAFGLMTSPAFAAPCKDAKGKFTKCPPAMVAKASPAMAAKPMAAAKPMSVTKAPAKRCRTAKGQFAKCGTPGAR